MPFPDTLIQIEAHPVECHRVIFNDTDENTGRRITSVPYATRADALEAWGAQGATEGDLVTTDARIDAIRSLLHELEDAFERDGTAGVTMALALREFFQAQGRLDLAGIELEALEGEA
ncbi:hypothetical protein [Leucobacter celer]|uniref:hypothetical protein n=1 Tax=Leucobacter celer TaxID=668625 RepID=UPI0006A76390|nr:hypothetical protein [Leucobacter celer]